MKHPFHCLLPALALVCALEATAAGDITKNITEPGTLAAAIGADTDATSLTVSGSIDVRDLDFINEKMKSLRTLNLADAKIAACETERLLTARNSFAANELPPMALAGSPATTIVLPKSLKVISEGALAGASMTSIEIPTSVTTLGAGAFAAAPSLTSVKVPVTVTEAGEALFRGCPKLATAELNTVNVPDYALADCPKLTSVTLNHFVESIGRGAFSGSTALGTVSINGNNPWSLRSIGDYAFYGTAIRSLDLSTQAMLHSIGSWAFADCRNLTTLILPAEVWEFGEGAMFNDLSLTEFTAAQPAKLGAATFKGVSSLDLNNVGGNAPTEWGPYAFYGMSSLTEIHLPDRLAHIGEHAFDGCVSLNKMNGPAIAQVPELEGDPWTGLDKPSITLGVPTDMIDAFAATPVWKEFNILKAGAGTTTDIADMTNGELNAAFAGSVLMLRSHNDMEQVRLYDLTGRLLHHSRPMAESVSVETSAWTGPVFIVNVTLADGNVNTVKIAR